MPKILVIDDEKDNLTLINYLLTSLIKNCDVLIAQSGAEGIEKAKKEIPDTIILDLMMPEMDGFEVCKELTANPTTKNIPVIVLTAYKTDLQKRILALELGADVFLTMPIDNHELIAQVNAMLRIKEAEDELKKRNKVLNDLVLEMKKKTRELQTSRANYQDLFENAPDMYFSINAMDAKILQCNNTAVMSLGYTKEEIIGKQIFDLYHPDCIQDVKKTFSKFITSGIVNDVELQARCKDGRAIHIILNATAIRDKKGNILYSRSSWRDITVRKRAEEVIKETTYLLTESQKVSNIGSYILDINKDKWTGSKILDNIFGITKDYQRNEKSWLNIVHPDQRNEMKDYFLNTVLKERKKFDKEYQIIRLNDKEERWIHGLGELSFDENNIPSKIVGTIQDITGRKLAENELKKSKKELQDLTAHLQSVREEERKLIAREIHDELGQALTALKMDASWLRKKIPKSELLLIEKTDRMIELTDTTAKKVRRISSELRPELLDDLGLSAAIEWLVDQFQSRTDIKYSLNFKPENIVLEQDYSIVIFRIVQETLTNINRHAEASEVKLDLIMKKNEIKLTVKDNGKGIDPFKISSPLTYGLIGIKERVNSLKGKVIFEGIKNRGTTIKVTIPL